MEARRLRLIWGVGGPDGVDGKGKGNDVVWVVGGGGQKEGRLVTGR